MTTAAAIVTPIAWWKEPTKEQWYAYLAAWAGWTLDASDFTAFLLIIAPIAKEFNVPVPEVAAVLTITLWMRLFGATASGWLADRIGRKTPLMISIAWYSGLQLPGRLGAELLSAVPLPGAARRRDGRGMAGRRRPCDGDLAGAFARLHAKAHGASVSCCRARFTGCSTIISVGVAC
jgi:hypothetical protein